LLEKKTATNAEIFEFLDSKTGVRWPEKDTYLKFRSKLFKENSYRKTSNSSVIVRQHPKYKEAEDLGIDLDRTNGIRDAVWMSEAVKAYLKPSAHAVSKEKSFKQQLLALQNKWKIPAVHRLTPLEILNIHNNVPRNLSILHLCIFEMERRFTEAQESELLDLVERIFCQDLKEVTQPETLSQILNGEAGLETNVLAKSVTESLIPIAEKEKAIKTESSNAGEFPARKRLKKGSHPTTDE